VKIIYLLLILLASSLFAGTVDTQILSTLVTAPDGTAFVAECYAYNAPACKYVAGEKVVATTGIDSVLATVNSISIAGVTVSGCDAPVSKFRHKESNAHKALLKPIFIRYFGDKFM
jgi:hypothetical protein